MTNLNYEAIGKFIYGAHRNGCGPSDMENWMADDLGVPRAAPGDEQAASALSAAFFTKYDKPEQLEANYARFIEMLKTRTASPGFTP